MIKVSSYTQHHRSNVCNSPTDGKLGNNEKWNRLILKIKGREIQKMGARTGGSACIQLTRRN